MCRFLTNHRQSMTDAEWEHILSVEARTELEQLQRFYVHWAHKESYTKVRVRPIGLEEPLM